MVTKSVKQNFASLNNKYFAWIIQYIREYEEYGLLFILRIFMGGVIKFCCHICF